MVVIYTNENNPAALKILIALKYASTPAEIKIVTNTDNNLSSTKLLPYVVVNEETVLISSNAAAHYFLSSTEADKEWVQQWLEFQSFELGPCIAVTLGSSSKDQNLKNSLLSKFKILNELLKETPINGISITACDISIWSTLYPLYADEGLLKEYFESFPNICNWMKKISEEKNIQDAVAQYKVTAGVVSYQALLAGAKYPGYTPSAAAESPTLDHVTIEEIAAAKVAWSKGLNKLTKPKKDVYPVLPVAGEKNVLITSALPYVNNVPHLGNIIGCVLSSDVFARFSRLCNWNTLLIGGTDEYGTATETKALEEGLTPQQICDKYFEIHNSIYRWFNIGFDYFGRTTTPEQTRMVQELFNTLNDNGFMMTQAVEQLLCQKCNRYLADRFVEGGCPHPGCNYEDARGDQCDSCGKLVNAIDLKNPRCKMCKSAPVPRTSSQFFLDLPKLEPLVLHWMEKSAPGWTNNAKVISRSWMKEGLKPRCITRDLKWGIPVPLDGYRDKVFYVWFDAPIGYISMTEKYSKEWKKWWQPAKETEITLYQFMAKDNVPFHSVMFPACMLGAKQGWTTVSHIMATEYLNYEDGKFSKSRGVGVFGTDAQNTGIPSDVWRFYLLYVRPEGQDSSFCWDDLATKNNSELLNNLGNFVNRALMFTEKFFDSKIPEIYPNDDDYTVLAHCTRELKGYVASLEKAKLRDGIRYMLAISKHGNQYMQSTQPWVLLKGSEEDKKRAGTVIGICCNITCLLATLMFPYMPDASRALKAQLNAPDATSILTPENPEIVTLLASGHQIGKAAPLFNKIELAFVQEMKLKFGGVQQASEKAGGDVVSDVKSLEKAVQEQADKVRSIKESGAAKPVWQPEVAILLDLKKKLEAAQKAAPKSDTPKLETISQVNGVPSADDIKKIEEEIEKQGLVVRKLKESGAAKAEWSPQVDKLLELKGKLAVATGKPLATPGKGKKVTLRSENKLATHNSPPDASCSTSSIDSLENEFLTKLKITDMQQLEAEFLTTLKIVDRHKLEQDTREQSSSNTWRLERKKRLTASNFGRICSMRPTTSTKNAVKNLLYDNFSGNMHTRYGQEHEEIAVQQFETMFNKKTLKVGLVVDKDKPYLAASPDRIVLNESAIVEVKCPSTAREFTPVDAVRKGIIKCSVLNNGELQLKRNDKYMYQIQGQLHVADVDKCYFIIWTPLGLSVEIIEKDDAFWEAMVTKLDDFYLNALLPEMVKEKGCVNAIQDYYLK